jgi:ATP-dependent Clp protease ATP-binding subunit ClpA
MFDRFTDQSMNALALARQEAQAPGGECLSPEYILLGLLGNECGALRVIEHIGVDVAALHSELLSEIERSPRRPSLLQGPFTDDARRILELAMQEAGDGGDHFIGTEHLLAGLLREADNAAARLLESHGILLAQVREELRKLPGPDGRAPKKD